jgi:hypothetical protein
MICSTAGKYFILCLSSQSLQTTNGSVENGSALKLKELNGHANVEPEEHDEEQYLDLIRRIMKKGERSPLSR